MRPSLSISRTRCNLALVAVAVLFSTTCTAGAAQAGEDDVRAWRKDGSGIYPDARPPAHWSDAENIAWKTELAGQSISSPLVVRNRVLTTAEPSDLVCLDADNGSILWQRSHSYRDALGGEEGEKVEQNLSRAVEIQQQIKQLQRELVKDESSADQDSELKSRIAKLQDQYDSLTRPYPPLPSGRPGNTTATPVSDGDRVWAAFGTGIVSCHTLEGERVWMRFVEAPGDRHSASPLLVDGLLIVHLKNLVALDPQTGEIVWTTETPARAGTPAVIASGSQSILITPAGAAVRAKDGQILSEKMFNLAYCSPIVHDNICYSFGNGTITAVRLQAAEGGQLQAEPLWETRGSRDHYLGSPVCHDGLLYAATRDGILEVYEAETGERLYRKRLDLGKGRPDPSLALAGPLYISGHTGVTVVVVPGRDFEQVARNELEGFSSSPVFHEDRIYIRAKNHLYAIEE